LNGEDTSQSALQGASLETASDTLKVDLEDGSALKLSANTRVKVEESSERTVRVGLSKGRVECEVAKNPQRDFVVLAHGVRVRVTGTRFSVQVAPNSERVEVVVHAGSVEVLPPGDEGRVHRLGPGERWSYDLRRAQDDDVSLPVEPSDVAQTEDPDEEATPPNPEPVRQAPKPNPTHEQAVAEDSASVEERAEPTSLTAKELLDQGNTARRAGDAGAAARAYEELLTKHPSDPRAGLAAFELGRLRMDRLGNLRGAASALRKAVALAPGAAFREDAMARLAQAYAAMGAGDSCRKAKEAYLSAYPTGVHVASVERLCPSN
jgi:transmembrane sensor